MNELEWTKKLWYFVERLIYSSATVVKKSDTILYGRERRLWDNIRVDILTPTFAAEVDWAPKYAEAIGQALLYALYTKKQPGIVLLMTDLKEEAKYIYRCKLVCDKLNIRLWIVDTKKSEVIDETGMRYEI